jgi:hypothetical protein
MRNLLLALAAVSAIVLTGCSRDDERAAEVQVRVRMCTSQGQTCFALPVPGADVQVSMAGSGTVLAEGKTDEAGRVKLPLDAGVGILQVTAVSPVFNGGKAETTTPFPDVVTSITLDGPITTAISSP